MKKETSILLFYVMYFLWLFAVTYLTFNSALLTYFTLFVSAFYLLLLREEGDIGWFIFGGLIPVVVSFFTFSNFQLTFSTANLQFFPIWLALAWGTTIVALRKLYFVIVK